MDNYEVTIRSTNLAAHILGIDVPDVQFFKDNDLTKKGINSVFIKDKYIIAFNEEWVEQANPMEIQITCFHETRHAFQWKCIIGEYSGDININPETIDVWNTEMSNYNQPTCKDIAEEFYLKQKIEIDSIAFAHKMMLEYFQVKTIIPYSIKEEVLNKVRNINHIKEEV